MFFMTIRNTYWIGKIFLTAKLGKGCMAFPYTFLFTFVYNMHTHTILGLTYESPYAN